MSRLFIINVSNPHEPQIINSQLLINIAPFQSGFDVSIDGSLILLIDIDSNLNAINSTQIEDIKVINKLLIFDSSIFIFNQIRNLVYLDCKNQNDKSKRDFYVIKIDKSYQLSIVSILQRDSQIQNLDQLIFLDLKQQILSIDLNNQLNIDFINISLPEKPQFQSNISFDQNCSSISASSDNNLLYIAYSQPEMQILTVINISNQEAYYPEIGDLLIREFGAPIIQNQNISKYLFMSGCTNFSCLHTLDVSVPEKPKLIGIYMGNYTNLNQLHTFSTNYELAYLQNNFTIISLQNNQYIQKLFVSEVQLGITNQTKVLPLKLRNNSLNIYDSLNESYKYILFSVFESLDNQQNWLYQQNLQSLPSFINFDFQNGLLTISPNDISDIGFYQFYAPISFQINQSCFIGIKNINSKEESINLILQLIQLGYIDNDQYLTSSYISQIQMLSLPLEFKDQEYYIRQKLSSFYADSFAQISIVSSLQIKNQSQSLDFNNKSKQYLQIITPSNNLIKALILIQQDTNISQARFVERPYPGSQPVFDKQGTSVTLLGIKSDVNQVLANLQIRISQKNSISLYTGNVTISDGLNPNLFQQLTDISQFFKINQPTLLNQSLNDQFIQTVQNLEIDSRFVFIPQFYNPDNNSLTFTINANNSESNKFDWINYDLQSGIIQGTPSEKMAFKYIDIYYQIYDGAETYYESFSIWISPSWQYIILLLIKILSPVITVIGFWKFRSLLHEIFFKNQYQYKVKEYAMIGQNYYKEIPLMYLQQQNAKIIWNKAKIQQQLESLFIQGTFDIPKIQQLVLSEIQDESQKNINWLTMIIYDMAITSILQNEKHLEELMIFKKIKKINSELYKKDWYMRFINDRQKMIQTLFNKELSEALVNDCIDLIDHNKFKLAIAESQMQIHELNVFLIKSAIIAEIRGTIINKSTSILSSAWGETLLKDKQNLRLIKAMKKRKKIYCSDKVKMKLQFLKLDYTNIELIDNRQLPDWIDVKIENDGIYIQGIPKLKDKEDLIIQILDNKNFVLKEFWIEVVDQNFQFNLNINEENEQSFLLQQDLLNSSQYSEKSVQLTNQKITNIENSDRDNE